MLSILVLCLFSVAFGGRLQDLKTEDQEMISCDNLYCAEGSECVDKYGKPQCECVESCMESDKPVCGSNGTHTKTYKSECYLFQEACQTGDSISVVAPMSCEEEKENEKVLTKTIEEDEKKVKPVVCMQKGRDALRAEVMKFLKDELDVEDEISYKGLLLKYFSSLDSNNDGALDTIEFMKIIDGEVSVAELLSGKPSSNAIVRGLCFTELMAITDYNSNYKLEFEEFHDCLNPTFNPAKEFCECDGRKYNDGNDIPKSCNTCKCACGHWVCTNMKCDEEENNSARVKVLADES